jgi:hypothetical protein
VLWRQELAAAGGFMTSAVVPGATTWLIKDIRLINNNGGAQTVMVQGTVPGFNLGVYLFNKSIAAFGYDGVSGMQFAMIGGDQLRLDCTAGPIRIWVSGVVLPG